MELGCEFVSRSSETLPVHSSVILQLWAARCWEHSRSRGQPSPSWNLDGYAQGQTTSGSNLVLNLHVDFLASPWILLWICWVNAVLCLMLVAITGLLGTSCSGVA